MKKKIIIDCDAPAHIPKEYNWTVEEHIPGGKLELNPDKINLFLAEKQKNNYISGDDLRNELKGKPVLNANVLDYLLEQPELIRETWKGKYIYFWGTIYRSSDDYLGVRYLYWRGGAWRWSYRWLDRDWYGGDPAAVLASSSQSLDIEHFQTLSPLTLESAIKRVKEEGYTIWKEI